MTSISVVSNNRQAHAQVSASDVKIHYTKQDVLIPTRDGVKMFTIVYAPPAQSAKYLILLMRTA